MKDILDETTNHLDIKYQLEVMNIVKKLNIGRSASFEDNRYGSISSLNEAGINTYVQLASKMNADNIFKKGGSVSFENVISSNPDYIVYVTANKNSATDSNAVDRILYEPIRHN